MTDSITISLGIIALRLLIPFTLLRWPLAGVALNIIGDSIDRPIVEHFGWGLFGNGQYQLLDKVLDIWYMIFLFHIIENYWKNKLARETGVALFLWRFIGVVTSQVTGAWYLLAFTPNIFEYFYVFWTIVLKWFPRFKLTPQRLIIILLAIGIPTIIQESLMHWLYVDKHLGLLDRFIFPWLW